jgi:glycosyltransferase involved in cell wall biosynthesis
VPSVEEGFGIAYLEAWMCRKPVVGARIPSTASVISEGVDGLLAEAHDAEDLARSLHTLLGDRDLRDRMGRAGREKTLANFTWDVVTDRWEAALQRVTAI